LSLFYRFVFYGTQNYSSKSTSQTVKYYVTQRSSNNNLVLTGSTRQVYNATPWVPHIDPS